MKFNLPGVHGGISQQSPNLRLQNQHEDSSNVLFDILEGARGPRWGTSLLNTSASYLNNIVGTIKTTDERTWFINWDGTALRLYDPFTPEWVVITDPVTYLPTGADTSEVVSLPILDTVILLNKKKTVEVDAVTTAPVQVPAAIIYIPQVYDGLTYSVTIDCKKADLTSIWAQTVSGTVGVGDTTDTVRAAIQAALTPPAGITVVGVGTNTIYMVLNSTIVGYEPTFYLTSNSDFDIRCFGVQPRPVDPLAPTVTGVVTTTLSYEDLPPTIYKGIYFQITEGYYVHFDGASYVECPCPGQSYILDKTTMPHQLSYTAGVWSFGPVTGYATSGRLVGDSTSAPMPNFVGKTLNNVFFHRNRLGLLADQYVAMSKVGNYYDWFPETATEVLDSDPIVVFPTSVKFSELLWAIPFSKQLLLFSPTKQYVLHSGYDSLTPQTVAIDEATSYTVNPSVEPLVLPASLILPLAHDPYLGVLEYRLDDQQIATEGSLLSSTVPRFIPNTTSSMVYLSGEHIILFYAKGSTTVHVYKFNKREDGQLTQMAWSSWEMPAAIQFIHVMDGTTVLFVSSDGGIIQMDTSESSADIALDFKETFLGIADGADLGVPDGYVAINIATGKQLDMTDGIVTTETTGTLDILTGLEIPWDLELSQLVLRDDNGLPRSNIAATIENIQLDTIGGEYSVELTGQGLPTRSKLVVPVTTTDVLVAPGSSADETVPTRILVMAPAKRAVITIRGTSYFPVQINNISYNLDISRDWG